MTHRDHQLMISAFHSRTVTAASFLPLSAETANRSVSPPGVALASCDGETCCNTVCPSLSFPSEPALTWRLFVGGTPNKKFFSLFRDATAAETRDASFASQSRALPPLCD